MPQELDIKVSGQSLELFPDEEQNFYLTKQIHDLSSLSTRNSNFSKTIDVPLTNNNIGLLIDNLPTSFRHTLVPIEYLDAEVLIKGVPVLTDSFVIIKGENKKARTVGLTIIGGLSRFFAQLKDNPVSELDFSDVIPDFDWTLAEIEPYVLAGNGGNARQPIQFCRNSWYTNESRRKYETQSGADDLSTNLDDVELGESGFIMFFKTMLDKIFSNLTGLTVDYGSLLSIPDFFDSGFFVPVPIVHDSYGAVEGTYEAVSISGYDLVAVGEGNILVPYDILTDAGVIWNPITFLYEFTQAGFFNVKVNASGSYDANALVVRVWKNWHIPAEAEQIAQLNFSRSNTTDEFEGSIETTVNVEAGDTLGVTTSITTPVGANVMESLFSIEEQGLGRGRLMIVSDMLPDISQKQFVKEVFILFNILATEKNRVVTLSLFEDIKTRPPVTLEFNNLLERSAFGAFLTYGTTNIMKYEDNDALERKDVNSFFDILDNTLVESVDKVRSGFSATDNSAVPGMTLSLSVPNYDLGFIEITDNRITVSVGQFGFTSVDRLAGLEAGDFISLPQGLGFDRRRIVNMISDKAGTVDVAWTGNQNATEAVFWRFDKLDVQLQIGKVLFNDNTGLDVWDGGNTQQYEFYSPVEMDALKWINLKVNYYDLLTRSILRPFVVVGWMSLGVQQYLSVDGLNPIYIAELDAYFYMNKMEQWKYNGSTRIELVKLSY